MNYINITSPADLKYHLQGNRPCIVYYYQRCPTSTKLHQIFQEIEGRDELQGVDVLRVPATKMGQSFFDRRAMHRLPTVSFHNGAHEFERLTGYSQTGSILKALLRLCQHINEQPST